MASPSRERDAPRPELPLAALVTSLFWIPCWRTHDAAGVEDAVGYSPVSRKPLLLGAGPGQEPSWKRLAAARSGASFTDNASGSSSARARRQERMELPHRRRLGTNGPGTLSAKGAKSRSRPGTTSPWPSRVPLHTGAPTAATGSRRLQFLLRDFDGRAARRPRAGDHGIDRGGAGPRTAGPTRRAAAGQGLARGSGRPIPCVNTRSSAGRT